MKKDAPWLAGAAIIFVVFGTIYGVAQQVQRNDADWPQVQIAEDVADKLNHGAKPDSISANKVNMNSSLAPFVIIYDKSGRVVSGSGYLNGRLPDAPVGILKNADSKAYHRISWQPKSDVRIAAVTVAADNYYVLSGRSLKQVESNANQTFLLAFAGGVVCWTIIGIGYIFANTKK